MIGYAKAQAKLQLKIVSELIKGLSKSIPNGDLCDVVTLDYKSTNFSTKVKRRNVLPKIKTPNLADKTFEFEMVSWGWSLGLTHAPSHHALLMDSNRTSNFFSAFTVRKCQYDSDLFAFESVAFPGFYLKEQKTR